MSTGIVSKLSELDYQVTEQPSIQNLPADLQPFALTEDGVLLEVLPEDDSIEDALFTAYGKLLTIKKYLTEHNLNKKYSVLLVLSTVEFKQLHPELRKSIYSDIPFIVL